MRATRFLVPAIALAGLFVAGGLGAEEAKLHLSNKWRVEVSEGANSDGAITFRVTPEGGEPVLVSASIKDGRGENGVADDINAAFRSTLDQELFHSETDDGEDVLLKKRHRAPDFELVFVESTVKSVRVEVEKE